MGVFINSLSVQGHAASKFVTGSQLATSSGRGWTNMLAERWSHAVGELTPVLTRDTEIDVLLSGGTLVERQGDGLRQTTPGQRGSLWIVPSGMQEDFVNVRRPAHDCLHIFLPAKPFADCILQDLDIDPPRVRLRYEAVGYDSFVEQIALAVNRELDFETSSGRLLIESLGHTLSAYLLHRYSESTLNVKPHRDSVRPIDHRRLSRVMEFIDARIEENFTVADMAGVACMSPAHFARSFKVTVGRSPQQFVSAKRLELAQRLLADPYRSMAEIALSAGFSSQSNFARAFRQASGMTPGAYRATYRHTRR
jgi:AraC family transcriptional regulator